MASPVYKNRLEKVENMNKLSKHLAQLDLISKHSERYPIIDESYRRRLY